MVALPDQPRPAPAVTLLPDRGEEKELLAPHLPAVLRQDPFISRLLRAFDAVWRPLFGLVDSIDVYLDAGLAPADQLAYLAAWLGVELPETLPEAARRTLVREAAALHRARGTKEALRRAVQLVCGVEPLITENTPGMRLDADGQLGINTSLAQREPNTVYVTIPLGADDVDLDALNEVVRAFSPAHARFVIRTFQP